LKANILSTTDPDEILLSFYQTSFRQILGVKLPTHLWPIFGSWSSFIKQTVPPSLQPKIKEQIVHYEQHIAPAVKTEPLRSFWQVRGTQPRAILDFGCGTGHTLRFLLRQFPEARGFGYEPQGNFLSPASSKFTSVDERIQWSTNWPSIANASWDVLLLIHVLHHIRHPGPVLEDLYAHLPRGGILYLYEDSWSDLLEGSLPDEGVSSEIAAVNYIFQTWSVAHKRKLFLRNEYWSNIWFYNRPMESWPEGYHPLERWETLVAQTGFRVITRGVLGFNPQRLHGVPAAWLIAEKP